MAGSEQLSAESFIVNVGAWAEAELHGVEVLALTHDLLELGGTIANYRITVEHGFVTLYGCRIDTGGPPTVASDETIRSMRYSALEPS